MTAVNLNRAIRGPVTAVPVVAGKGVRLVADTVNNRFVAEADETVLFDGGSTPVYSANLTEAASNFERLRIMVAPEGTGTNYATFVEINPNADGKLWDLVVGNGLDNAWLTLIKLIASDDYLTLTANRRKSISFGAYTSTSTSLTATSAANPTCILKVVGINRIANN